MSDNNTLEENICTTVSSPKEKTEICLNLFKLIYYCSITGGIIWHLAYYAFTIRVLPDLDIANLIGYLISIFVIGFFITLFFIYFFVFPGLIVMYASRSSETTEYFKKWVNKKKYKIKNGYLIFLTSAIATLIFSSISQGVSRLKNIYLTGTITLYIIHLIMPVIASALVTICCAKYIPPKKERPSNFYLVMFLSVISFIAPITIIFLLVILPMEHIEFSAYIVMLLIGFLLAAVTNGLIATEDFIFKKEIKDPLVKHAVGFLSLLFLIITLAFCFDMYTEKRNPLISTPFKMLRIGQIDANINLDEEYVKKSNLGKFSNILNTFRFKILSSIGSEYIVQHSSDSPSDFRMDEFKDSFKIETLCEVLKRDGYDKEQGQSCSIERLNKLLEQPDLYEQIEKRKPSSEKPLKAMSAQIQALRQKYITTNKFTDLERLNRAMLVEFYPHETPRNQPICVEKQYYPAEYQMPECNLLRIPKSKVLLVEYMDSKKQ